MIGNTSGGCEPIYNVAYYKNVTDDIQGDEMLVEFDSLFLKTLEVNDIDVELAKKQAEELMENNEFDGPQSIPCVPDELASLFVTTSDLDSQEHASVLCALQEGVDSSISKTLNAPNDATVEDAKNTFQYVYDNGGKSVTFYRDGSRTKQVNTTRKDNQEVDDSDSEEMQTECQDCGTVEGCVCGESGTKSNGTRKRPKVTSGQTERIDTGYGKLYVTIAEDEYGIADVFANLDKSGSTTQSFTEPIAKLISVSLRNGVSVDEVVDQLKGVQSPNVAWDGEDTINSVPDAIATALERYQERKHGDQEMEINHPTTKVEEPSDDEQEVETSGDICPDCDAQLIFVEGCKKCPDTSCGYSKC